MNNSNFRKKLSGLKSVSTSTCIKAMNNLGDGGKNIEREARFGRFQQGRFSPGVSERQFNAVAEYFKTWETSRTVDKVTSRTLNPRQNIRRIVSNNGKDIYQLKEKMNVVDVPNEGIRLSKSKEITMSIFKNEYNKLPARGQYSQVRERISFKKGKIQIDLTRLPQNRQTTFHVEIEFEDKQDGCRYIKIVKEILESIQTTGIVFAQYRDLVKTPRFIGPLPQTLTLDAFKKKVLTKSNYSVTEKADGERFLLFIDAVGGFNLISRGMNIKQYKKVNKKPDFAGTLVDGEFMNGYFYAFDILFVSGQDIRSKKLKDRLLILFSVISGMKSNFLKIKKFFIEHNDKVIELPSNKNSPYKNIYEAAGAIWKKRKSFPYSLDGLIFTPADEGYSNKNIYKWKDENTIDFYYKDNQLFLAGNKENGTYGILPFSGLDRKGNFKVRGKIVKNEIFTSEVAPVNIRRGFLENDIPGNPMVGEFKFDDNTFKLIRKRPDKEFPNGVEASNQSWEAIVKPVTIEMIEIGPGALRDFHSEIKAKLIMKYAKNKSVLDIGSGKGEDVGKYVKAKSKPVVGFDLVQEEYPHPNYMTFHKVSNPIYNVKNFINKNQKFDVININFAIHYFLGNKKLFESLILNIHDNIKKGGIVMATVLDGKKIYQALKNKNKVSTSVVNFEKKYNNSLNFNSPKFKFLGQKVNVMVKGTKYFGNKPITEFLFNFTKFLAIMEKMDFELVEMKNFSELCSDSPWCRRYMSANEKDYSFKNIYFILKRK